MESCTKGALMVFGTGPCAKLMWGPGAPREPTGPQTTQNLHPNWFRMAPKWHPNGVQMAPKGSNVIVLLLLSVARVASRIDKKSMRYFRGFVIDYRSLSVARAASGIDNKSR